VKVSKLTGGLASFYPIHIPQQKAALKVPLYSFSFSSYQLAPKKQRTALI
jgi:hypothetical protein